MFAICHVIREYEFQLGVEWDPKESFVFTLLSVLQNKQINFDLNRDHIWDVWKLEFKIRIKFWILLGIINFRMTSPFYTNTVDYPFNAANYNSFSSMPQVSNVNLTLLCADNDANRFLFDNGLRRKSVNSFWRVYH